MAMIKPECKGCANHLEVTDGCLRIGHGMECRYAPAAKENLIATAYRGEDAPRIPTAKELDDIFRTAIDEGGIGAIQWVAPEYPEPEDLKRSHAAASAMLQSAFEKTGKGVPLTLEEVKAAAESGYRQAEVEKARRSAESAFSDQIGGSHYKSFKIQPAEFIQRNGIGFLEGCVIKRMCRWQSKDGLKDLHKAIHEIELLIEMQEEKP